MPSPPPLSSFYSHRTARVEPEHVPRPQERPSAGVARPLFCPELSQAFVRLDRAGQVLLSPGALEKLDDVPLESGTSCHVPPPAGSLLQLMGSFPSSWILTWLSNLTESWLQTFIECRGVLRPANCLPSYCSPLRPSLLSV